MITAPVMSATAAFDPTDVPNADPAHLMRMLAVLIRNGDGLVVLREPDPRAMKAIEAEFWADFSGDTATGVATVIRFRALIEVFAARRLKSLLLREGLVVLQAAFRVAAGLRLNSARGFNPQGLVWAVTAVAASQHGSARPDYAATTQMAA